MNEEDDNSDETGHPTARLYGYALARLMKEDDATRAVTAVTSTNQSSQQPGEQELIHALRQEIRHHFTNKYACPDFRAKSLAEAEEMVLTPFESSVKLASVHTDMLKNVSPKVFWEASKECLELLHPVQADVYVLREMEDVQCDEISEITGLTFELVLELVYRGRMMFVACLLKRIDSHS